MMAISTTIAALISQIIPAGADGEGYWGEICAAARTSDGGLAIAGHAWNPDAGSTEILVMRLGPTGEPLWTRVLRGTGNSRAYAITQTTDEGLAVAGITGGSGDHSILVFKLSPSGELAWARAFMCTGREYACSITEASGKGLTVKGYTWNPETESVHTLVFTLDQEGNLSDNGNGIDGIPPTTVFPYGLVDGALGIADPGTSLRVFVGPALFSLGD